MARLLAWLGYGLCVVTGRAELAAQEDALVGLWASETTLGPALEGELSLAREGGLWRARLDGAETAVAAVGDIVRFAFPGGRGRFRGMMVGGDRRIEGFWLQPAGEVRRGSGQPFATPVVLERRADDVWKGEVRPLDDRFTLYLKIFRSEEGALVGAFRNPELNEIGGASRFRVTRNGNSVQFSVRYDDTSPEIAHDAVLLEAPVRLRLFWPGAGRVLELSRRAPEEAPAFFPRPPGGPRYVYKRPEATGDGWTTAPARDVGIDEAALARVVQAIIDSDPAARRPILIHSILVARRGRLVLEEYFFGHEREQRHDLRSAGKTLASVMLGVAMREGVAIGPETRMYQLLAARGPFANPDPRKAEITLAHLLTHTSGLACDDNDDASPGNEGTMQAQDGEPDWWKYTLDLPMAHDPGSRYAYCSANVNLMGAALTDATRTWLPAYFDRAIARPLDFGSYSWNLMPTAEGYLGGGAFLRPRDLLKVGQVYLDGGQWRGRRLVEAAWVARSTAPRVEVTPATTGLDPERFSEFYAGGVDGYAWHSYGVRVGERVFRDYEATGNGGQVLIVVPDFDLVVVFTGGNYRQGGVWGRWRDDIVGAGIIPAIRE